MEDQLRAVRSLQTNFVMLENTENDIVLAVDSVEMAGTTAPGILRFSRPRQVWASRWDSSARNWQDAPEFCLPTQGQIREAHIKLIPVGISASFTDRGEPLVRWGLIADSFSVEPSTDSSPSGA